jgi:methionyl-tRNA synthetase
MSSNNKNRIYITVAIDYVNARPHIGHALEKIQADVIARYYRKKGWDTRLLMGTDENALKNVLAAKEAGISVKEFVDKNTEIFRNLQSAFNLSWDDFIRTTEKRHIEGVEKFWKACHPDDIYKKTYAGLYCIGCEEFKTEKDLVGGRCPEHPNKPLEEVREENYFFRLSRYSNELRDLIASDQLMIIPEARKNEMLSFIESGLEDFSISRSRARAHGWGIPVPGDPDQVIYVWFDALLNYITALGYGSHDELFKKYWEENEHILHVIGKGITRFHAIYWPAMLFSANIKPPRMIFSHGYITIEGQKISKSLGNGIDPYDLVKEFGREPVRYYLLREIPAHGDGDFSRTRFIERYNGELANGIGNLVSRVATLGENISPLKLDFKNDIEKEVDEASDKAFQKYESLVDNFRLNEALGAAWELISFADRYINDQKPWQEKEGPGFEKTIKNAGYLIGTITNLLEPFLPETAEKIREQIRFEDSTITIKKGAGLFPRL